MTARSRPGGETLFRLVGVELRRGERNVAAFAAERACP